MRAQVYIPVAVEIDTETQELLEIPQVDFDGAPWRFVGSEANIWMVTNSRGFGEHEWLKDFDIEQVAIQALDEVFKLVEDLRKEVAK